MGALVPIRTVFTSSLLAKLVVATILTSLLAAAGPAWAASDDELFDEYGFGALMFAEPPPPLRTSGAQALATDAQPISAIFKLNNRGYTLQPSEPTWGGKMTKTAWARFTTGAEARRIVIHTYGSDIDTVLAVYRGTTLATLAPVVGNDNRPVTGLSATHSLVQFDATPNTDYRVQVGGINNAEGDIQLNAFSFPPGGGLSAFLYDANGPLFNSRDYMCALGAGNPFSFSQCPPMTFVVHNSTNQTLTVTTTTSLGAGMVLPAPFTLNPGAAKLATVSFGPGFDTTTVRTLARKVIFTGRAGATVVRAEHRALVYSKGATLGPDVLRVKLESPEIRTGYINEPVAYRVKLTNTGAVTAIGCHFRSDFTNLVSSYFKTVWQRIDPATGASINALNTPAAIPAGGAQTFIVSTASQVPYRADPNPSYSGPVQIDCANTTMATIDLANRFDITARGTFEAAEIAPTVSPASRLVNVPAGSSWFFRVTAINTGPAATLSATPRYVRPLGEDDPQKLFGVAVCRTATLTGPCLAPEASSVSYAAATGASNFFRVRVTAPAVDPGFDPGYRRVFLNFEQDALNSVGKVVVGAPSVAVKRQ